MRATALLFLIMITSPAAAQEQSAPVEKEIVLNGDKRIVESNYRVSTDVSARGGEAGGWHLNAGATIEAERIDLTLRGVKGIVRFRADTRALTDVFERSERRRRAVPPTQ